MQYFKKGFPVVARNLNLRLCRMKVVIFQLMIKTPNAIPVMKAPRIFTDPKYSGEKNKASAPNPFMKPLFTVLNNRYQKKSRTWYFLKCKMNNCTGKEYQVFSRNNFIWTN